MNARHLVGTLWKYRWSLTIEPSQFHNHVAITVAAKQGPVVFHKIPLMQGEPPSMKEIERVIKLILTEMNGKMKDM